MKEFRLLTISAPSPYERGVQYGQQAEREIDLCIETYRSRFSGTRNLTWEEAREISWKFLPYIEDSMPDMLEELKGIAAGSQTDLADLMVLNCRYEILHFPHENECTAFALQREVTANHHVYVGQNWDNRSTLLPHSLLLHITEEENGRRIFGLTEAGQLIRNGFTSSGVGQCSNSLRSSLDVQGAGIPSTFVRRKLLTLDRLEDMVALIRTAPRSVSVNYCVASRENTAADIEAVPGQPVRFDPVNGIVTHANHLLVNRDLDVSTACTSCSAGAPGRSPPNISWSACGITRATPRACAPTPPAPASFGRPTPLSSTIWTKSGPGCATAPRVKGSIRSIRCEENRLHAAAHLAGGAQRPANLHV